MPSLLSRERIVAPPDYPRWLVPPAALLIHLSIGQAYAYSVFNLPLTREGGWTLAQVGWIFTLFFVVLGVSAALFGRWLERVGPRLAGVVAACCWGGGYLVAALGVRTHQLWIIYLGNGLIGGCGLGLGYISPVSTLVKWFPDRRGMATGLAIMGFGGGAMIGAPLGVKLMAQFGLERAFVGMGLIYFVAMLAGAFLYRVPPEGWRPLNWTPPAVPKKLVTDRVIHVDEAFRTRQFWLLWLVLCLNVSAGIGVLGQASPMIQEVFRPRVSVADAAAFVSLLSLFNILGRIGWASLSDKVGRKATYAAFFTLGIALYATVPLAGRIGSIPLFVACLCLILSMYGGGFATIPAYLADLFGPTYVGAIHGRLLTAWSTAGIVGPAAVNYIRQYQIGHGVPAGQAYNVTMYLMTGLLLIGLLCNLAVRPVPESAT